MPRQKAALNLPELQAALAACIATAGYAATVHAVAITLEEAGRTIRAIDAADVADGQRLAVALRRVQPPKGAIA